MTQFEIITRIILAVAFGAILGLETETREVDEKGFRKAQSDEQQRIGGVRTYSVISLIGAIAGLLFLEGEMPLVYMIFGSLIILVFSAYVLNVQWKHLFGMTTEIAIIITFLLGFLATSQILDLTVILAILVILTFFLSQKRGLGQLVKQINHQEIIDLTKFGLIGIVILPILPDKSYTLSEVFELLNLNADSLSLKFQTFEIINPFNIWLVVVLISGFNLMGYILSKFVGTKGSLLAEGLFGGLVSSTSTIISLAQQSKNNLTHEISVINAGSALIANSVSFIQILMIVYVSNFKLFKEILPPFLAMGTIGLILGIILIVYVKPKTREKIELSSEPFSLIPAMKFVILIITIKIFIQLAQLTSIDNIFLVVTALSGVIGMDAPTFAISDLNASQSLTTNLAITGILLGNAFNIVAKMIYGKMFGSREFGNILLIGLTLTLAGTLVIFW
ncbi:MAG: hypothetical protein KatS3mg085_500 [Candidatus Dojkabacteria bacterium]|nr:MAG: hypothetical protein KatS3mg085_500 [Candidatus Dojkabacteria bacterium]